MASNIISEPSSCSHLVSGLLSQDDQSTSEYRLTVAKRQYIPGLGNKLGIKNMREGSMSEVMAETSEGDASNVPGSNTKLGLVPREMLDHCLRKVCDTWRAHQHSFD